MKANPKTKKKIINTLKSEGERITQAREQIVSIVVSSDKPLTAPEIQEKLEKAGVSVNKTTVYRELTFLVGKDLVSEVHLETGVKHYEMSDLPHHHHLVCNSCGDISELENDKLENSLEEAEENAAERGFRVDKHMLEFYGRCASCAA